MPFWLPGADHRPGPRSRRPGRGYRKEPDGGLHHPGPQQSLVRPNVILDRFPDGRAFALPSVIQQMRQGSTPEFLASFWNPRFPRQIPIPRPRRAAPRSHDRPGGARAGRGGTRAHRLSVAHASQATSEPGGRPSSISGTASMNPQGKSGQLPARLSDLFFEPLVNETGDRSLRWYRTTDMVGRAGSQAVGSRPRVPNCRRYREPSLPLRPTGSLLPAT
jgi:hypothetical protein